MATDHNFKVKKGLHVLGSEGIYLTDTNTRLHEGSGNALRISTDSGGYVDLGSMNSGWVHMQMNKNLYILPSTFVAIDGNLQPYNDSSRTLGANDKRWSHIYGDALTIGGDIISSGTIKNGSYTRILTGDSNTGQITFNANFSSGAYTPDYNGASQAGMSVIKMKAGGYGGLEFYVKNHGTATGTHALNTFTKVAEMHQSGYFDASNGLRVGGIAFADTSRNITAGTISSGAITSSGAINSTGTGIQVNGTTRINSVGDIIGTSYYIGGTNIIDTSGNLTNIGTISSGEIDSSGRIKATNWIELESSGSAITSEEAGIRIDYNDTAAWYIYKDNGNDAALHIQSASASGEGDGTPRVRFARTSRETYFGGSVGINQYSITSGSSLDVNGKVYISDGQVWDATTQGQGKGSIHIDPNSTTDHAGGAITFGASDHSSGTVADAGIYIRSDGSYGTKMYLATTDSYATGSKTSVFIDASGHTAITRGHLKMGTSTVISSNRDITNIKTIDVDPDANGPAVTLGRYSGQPTIKAKTDDGGYLIMDSTSNLLGLNWYVAQNVVLANGGGRVGIRHNAPNAHLHIGAGTNSSVTVGDQTNPAFQIGGTTNYRLGMYTSSEGAVIENKNGDDGLQFRVKTAGEAMRINGGTGDVRIGTSAIIGANEAFDTSNLALHVHGHQAIERNYALYLGVTGNNYNSWQAKFSNSGSTAILNAQAFQFDNTGYGSSIFFVADSSGLDIRTGGLRIGNTDFVTSTKNIHGFTKNFATSIGWRPANSITSQTGYYGGNFSINGSASENNIEYTTLPDGSRGICWNTPSNDSTSNADGGWNKNITGLPSDDLGYMSVVYVRRNGTSTNGNFYHGCSGSHTLNTSGSANTNPYFISPGISTLPQDVWCVSIGYIRANSDGNTSNTSSGGVYRCDTGERIHTNTDFKMKDGSTEQTHRTYLYYATNTASSLSWAKPGFYAMDGTEPAISDLIRPGKAGATFNDLVRINSTNNNALYINGNGGGLRFQGGNNRIYFNGYRALEGHTDGSTLQIGEQYSLAKLEATKTQVPQFMQVGDATATGYGTNDGSWGARLNVSDSVHSKIEVSQENNSMRSHWYAHTGHDSIKFGTATGHDVEIQRNGVTRIEATGSGAYVTGTLQATGDILGGTSSSNSDGQNNRPFRLDVDRSSYMVAAAGNTWGLFWAGNSGARYGTNGNGGPGNIWGNSGNPNEFAFVGSDSTAWTVYGNTGHTWQKGNFRMNGALWEGLHGGSGTGTTHLNKVGGIRFGWSNGTYGHQDQHSIRSTYGNSYGDNITLNSYNHIRFNIDSNNNDSTSYFEVGHHGTHTSGILMRLTSPSGNFEVDGNVTAYSSSISDAKYKDNIEQLKGSLDKVLQLRGVEFDWTATRRKGMRDIGFIAQEVEPIVPEVVTEQLNGVGEFSQKEEMSKSIAYDKLVPLLVESIKEQQKEIDELKSLINSIIENKGE